MSQTLNAATAVVGIDISCRRWVVLIKAEDLGAPWANQRPDKLMKDREVAGYSMTSSASASIVGGMSRPMGAFVGMWRDRVADFYSKYMATAAARATQ